MAKTGKTNFKNQSQQVRFSYICLYRYTNCCILRARYLSLQLITSIALNLQIKKNDGYQCDYTQSMQNYLWH